MSRFYVLRAFETFWMPCGLGRALHGHSENANRILSLHHQSMLVEEEISSLQASRRV